jgi:hypothetical protein
MKIDEAPTSRSVAEREALDDTHRWAIEYALRGSADGSAWTDGAYLAVAIGRLDGAEHTGTFLMAHASVLAARAIEESDRLDAFCEVARQWWADPAHRTSYGAPWSPGGAR